MAVNLLNVKGLQALDPSARLVMMNLMGFASARSTVMARAGMPTCATARSPCRVKAGGGPLLWTGDAKAVALGPRAGNA